MSPRPSALLDECVDPALGRLLLQRGFDVVSLQVIGPRSLDDQLVLARSTALGRVLITQNARHFKRVHSEFIQHGWPHGGIVCVPQAGLLIRREIRIAMMLNWIATQEYASRLFVWGDLQRLLESGFHLPTFESDEVREVLGWR